MTMISSIGCLAQVFSTLRRSSFYYSSQVIEKCAYPPIVDMSEEGQKRHNRQLWYDSIQAMPTVEEKLHELSVQQRTALKVFCLSSCMPTYIGLPFAHYITRTHLINKLPEKFVNTKIDDDLTGLKESLCEVLLKYFYNEWIEDKSKTFADNLSEKECGVKLVNGFLSQIYKQFSLKYEHLLDSTIHRKTRVDSFWWHGGFHSEKNKIYEQNICFQFREFPALTVRMKKPLEPIVDMNDPLCCTPDVIDYNFHPKIYGSPFKRDIHITSVPGFWPGDPYEFPLLSVYTSDKLHKLQSNLENYDISKIEDSFGVMSSFGWLNSIATYQGFTPFHDITYPLVNQMILTNGQDWNFFVYQLNTISFHSDVDKRNKRNICYSSGKLRLFDAIEDGQVKGINDEVLQLLIKFILSKPKKPEGVILKPYLGEDIRSEDEKLSMRFFLRRMYSQAPDPQAHKNEIPMWQRIYKLHPDAPPSPYVKLA